MLQVISRTSAATRADKEKLLSRTLSIRIKKFHHYTDPWYRSKSSSLLLQIIDFELFVTFLYCLKKSKAFVFNHPSATSYKKRVAACVTTYNWIT